MSDGVTPRVREASAIEAAVTAAGLLRPRRPVVVLLSGGRDSVCLLDLCVRIAGRTAVSAVHCNYGLRPSAGSDEALCRALCQRLGVPLEIHRPARPQTGNLQGWARDERYGIAARLALPGGADVAAGHTAGDQVETVLYRLAASPGRRALLGMRPREGGVVRPLLDVSRQETAAYCRARGLAFVDDPTNAAAHFARNRVRHTLVPALRSLHPAAEDNVLGTLAVLRDEAELLDGLVAGALAELGEPPRVERLRALAPALARLVVQALADQAAGGRAPAIGPRTLEILALGARGGSAALDLPGGLRAHVVYGELRLRAGERAAASPAAGASRLPVPGRLSLAAGELTSRRGRFAIADGSLDAAALASELEVRAWRPGDRMRPLGLGGSKTLQDLFTDAKVPRERRARLPVVVSDGEIAWVPGVATAERFRVAQAGDDHVRLIWAERQYD